VVRGEHFLEQSRSRQGLVGQSLKIGVELLLRAGAGEKPQAGIVADPFTWTLRRHYSLGRCDAHTLWQ
jgi:hypothetical protein